MAEHSTLLHQLRSEMTSGFDQLRSEMTSGFDQLRSEMTSGSEHVNSRIDQLNDRIFRLMLAVIAVGGGVIAALVALLITLIVQA